MTVKVTWTRNYKRFRDLFVKGGDKRLLDSRPGDCLNVFEQDEGSLIDVDFVNMLNGFIADRDIDAEDLLLEDFDGVNVSYLMDLKNRYESIPFTETNMKTLVELENEMIDWLVHNQIIKGVFDADLQ